MLALSSVDGDRATQRNGIGFNGRDSAFGNSLAKQVTKGKELSPKQYGIAYRMLSTYKKQLKDFDIDYDQIEKPEASAPKDDQPKSVDFQGGLFLFSFPYDASLKEELKESIPGARWDPTDKIWTAPVEAAVAVGKFAVAQKFKVESGALKVLTKTAQKTTVEQDENVKLSYARDADIELEGIAEGMSLHGFQKAGVSYALKNLKPGKGIYIGDEMGLGKTPQSLTILRQKGSYPALVAMPRVVWLKWAKEVQKWTPGLKVVLLTGRVLSPKTKLVAKRFDAEIVKFGQKIPKADIYLVKYSVLYKWTAPTSRKAPNSKYKKIHSATGELSKLRLEAVVFDEAHYLKDDSSQRTRAALGLVHTAKPKVRIALSGTPRPNRTLELLPMLVILDRLKDVASSEWDFRIKFCDGHKNAFGWEFKGSSNSAELNRLMRSKFYVQHSKLDRTEPDGTVIPGVLRDLPPIQPDYIPADLENHTVYDVVQADLDDKKAEYAKAMRSLDSAVTRGGDLSKLKGWVKKLENEVGVLSNLARKVCGQQKLKFTIEWLENFLETSDEKIIVFAHHRDINEAIAQKFDAPLIYGGTSESERQEAEDRFNNDPNCRILVAQIEAGGVGWDGTAAGFILFAELPYRPMDIDQAIGRAWGRLSDIHGVGVGYMVAYGTIDVHILDEILEPKREEGNQVVIGA